MVPARAKPWECVEITSSCSSRRSIWCHSMLAIAFNSTPTDTFDEAARLDRGYRTDRRRLALSKPSDQVSTEFGRQPPP